VPVGWWGYGWEAGLMEMGVHCHKSQWPNTGDKKVENHKSRHCVNAQRALEQWATKGLRVS
jgi:hypothetical protein